MVYPATVSLFIVAAASTQLFPFTDKADDTYSVVDSISLTVSRLATHGVVQIDARKETIEPSTPSQLSNDSSQRSFISCGSVCDMFAVFRRRKLADHTARAFH